MRNNNQSIIKKLSARSLKSNRRRNFFAMTAIVLVCLFFTGIFTAVDGMTKSFERQTMRQVGTSSHAGFKDITFEEYNRLKEHKDVKECSYNIFFGTASNPELMKRQVELRYTEEKDFEWTMAKLIEGHLPKEKMDVVLDTFTLNYLNVPHEIGSKVSISYEMEGKEVTDEFTLCGYYEGEPLSIASEVYFSREYVDGMLSVHTQEEWKELAKRGTGGVGLLQMSVMYKNSKDIEGRTVNLVVECGFDPNEINFGINWAYVGGNQEDTFTTALVVGMIIIILLCGYLIISNIFYISIVGDIRFYGLLKTMGTTAAQMKKIIHKQADRLCLMGIPAGLVAGWLFGTFLTEKWMSVENMEGVVSLNPFIFLFSIFFTFLTVRVGCRKSARMVKKISPVEAVKYTQTGKIGKYKGTGRTGHFSTGRMAFKNLFREKKKAVSVFLSMVLGMFILLIVCTIVQSFSLEKYADNMMGSTDIVISSAHRQNMGIFSDECSMAGETDSLSEYFSEIEGCKVKPMVYGSINAVLSDKALLRYRKLYDEGFFDRELEGTGDPDFIEYYDEVINNILEGKEGMENDLYGMEAETAEGFRAYKGEFDAEKYKTGKYIILAGSKDMVESVFEMGGLLYDIGDLVELGGKSYEVMAFIEIPYRYSVQSYSFNSVVGVLPPEELMGLPDMIYSTYGIAVYVPREELERADGLARTYTESVNPTLEYASKLTVIDELNDFLYAFKLAGGVLSVLVFIIALMNFINVIITGILSRRTEFAMLNSIGMEEGQKMQILYKEALWQVLISGGISLAAGSLFCHTVLKEFCNSMSWLSYRFSLIPLLAGIAFFLAAGMLVTYFYCKMGRKMSVVEALREG